MSVPQRSASTQPLSIAATGLPIFALYKNRRYEAILFPDRSVHYDGQDFTETLVVLVWPSCPTKHSMAGSSGAMLADDGQEYHLAA